MPAPFEDQSVDTTRTIIAPRFREPHRTARKIQSFAFWSRVSPLLWSIFPALPVPVSANSVVAPEWTVQVVDETGRPVQGAKVVEKWQHYTYETQGHEETAVTDKNGFVTFQKRRITLGEKASHLFVPLDNLHQGVHTSFGPRAGIYAWKCGSKGALNYDPKKKELPHKLVLKAGWYRPDPYDDTCSR
jgi:hypothetical protein